MKNIRNILSVCAAVLLFGSCSNSFLQTAPTAVAGQDLSEHTIDGLHKMVDGLNSMCYTYDFGQATGRGYPGLAMQLSFLTDDVFNTISAWHMFSYRWQGPASTVGYDDTINWQTWDFFYTIILHANTVLANIDAVKGPEADKANLKGQAYIFRAWAYHNLVQLFGKRYVKGAANDNPGVILRLKPEFEPQKRATVAEVYAQISKDLEAGLPLLEKADYGVEDPNELQLQTALGIAARYALTMSDWAKAESYAAKGIEVALNKGFHLDAKGLLNGFNKVTPEWIWGFSPNSTQNFYFTGFFAVYAYNFENRMTAGLRFAVNRSIYDMMGAKDVRRQWFVCFDRKDKIPADAFPSYFNGGYEIPMWEVTGQSIKFKTAGGSRSSVGDIVMMRLSELYYILAEAQARQGKDVEAQKTLSTVMVDRDPDFKTTAVGEELLAQIMNNKRIDLFEEGQRFFDMKRLGIIPDRLNTAKRNLEVLQELADRYSPKLHPDTANPVLFQQFDLMMEDAKSRNSGDMTTFIPKSVDDKHWEFAIPYQELKGNKLCKQNPL